MIKFSKNLANNYLQKYCDFFPESPKAADFDITWPF